MENINYQVWATFYQEFANKLLLYKDNRKDLIEIIKQVYIEAGLKLPTLETDNNIVDIDPFTVFGLFNKGITDENRIRIITSFAKALNISVAVPNRFDGIPVVNNMTATFYNFKESRGVNDIQNLWNVFEYGLKYADAKEEANKNLFVKHFNVASKQKGVKWNLTFGLYWCRPYNFINLDVLSRSFLSNPQNGMSEPIAIIANKRDGIAFPTGVQYVEVSEKCREFIDNAGLEFKNLPELSHYIWLNKNNNNDTTAISKAQFLKWFAPLIQALKDLGGSATRQQVVDKIAENEKLSDDVLNETRGKNNFKKFNNDVTWARNYLVYAGIIDKRKRGIWTLTEYGKKVVMTDELASQIFRKNWWSEPTDSPQIDRSAKKRYWLYAPGHGASKWEEFYKKGIMGIGWDELSDCINYSSREDVKLEMQSKYGENESYMNASLTVWQFANEMQIGDIVYSKKGLHCILGRGIIESDYIYDKSRKEYRHIRKIKWTHKGQFDAPQQLVQKTLTDVTQYTENVAKLEALFVSDEENVVDEAITYPEYTKQDFLSQVYMCEENYERLTTLLSRKKNIILQGAPGVGKTYAAKRLAYSIMGEMDSSRVEMIQFHQSYAYEDFIMGYRPNDNGFNLEYGAFYKFCKKAQDDNEREYFFIIDEINRGNLSKIFGELFMLVEHDKRDEHNSIRLLYADEQFYIPSNVHIIGMMNTADRSLAMLDYALRRRFAFFEMEPAFESEGFKKQQEDVANPKFDKLIEVIKQLNVAIKDDVSLGGGFRIGHSYFTISEYDVIDECWLDAVVNYEVIPLLQEYWFDESSKVEAWVSKLQGAIA